MPASRPWQALPWARGAVAGGAVALGAAVLVVLMARDLLDHAPLYDELLHVLAARGLNATGAPEIADGVYTRASLFTALVAASIATFGDTLAVARLPSLCGAALLLALVGHFVTRRAGLVAGAVAAITLCLLPQTLQLAVFVRFYTWHALVVAAMAMLAFEAATPGGSHLRRTLCIVGALLLLPVGWHLQPSTAIALACVIAGAGAVLVMDHWRHVAPFLRRHWIACAVAVTLAGAALLYIAQAAGLLAMFREVPVWAAWAADKKLYYVQRLAGELPLLWPLFPVAVLLALRSSPRLAVFCVVVFASGLLVHSIAASKHVRYVYYLMPFAAVVVGLAAASLFGRQDRPLRLLGMVALVGVTLSLSAEGQRLARVLAGRLPAVEALPYLVEPDWTPVEAALSADAGGTDRIVTSNAMKALYHMGRSDYELNASIVPETLSRTEFGIDPRTGRPAISTAMSLARVVSGRGVTLVVLEAESLGRATHVPVEVVAWLDARCEARATGAAAGIRTWRCSGATTGSSSAADAGHADGAP
jgi:hypothetical protein